jgi:hypothetical protein
MQEQRDGSVAPKGPRGGTLLLKLDLPDSVFVALDEYFRILRADAAAWSVPEILVVTGGRRIA